MRALVGRLPRAAAAAAVVLAAWTAAAAVFPSCAYPGCPGGTSCNTSTPATCASLLCSGDVTTQVGACVAPTCTDSVTNAFEPAVDCGGGCRRCGDVSRCFVPGDCASRVCADLGPASSWPTCRPASCADGAANGLEVDIDCGTVCCPRDQPLAVCPSLCRDGYGCSSDRDCLLPTSRCRVNVATGAHHCAGKRVTDDAPELSSRVIAALRLGGLRKRSLNATALLAGLAFMVGVQPGQLQLEALTDVPLQPQWGAGAYADVRAGNAGVLLDAGTGTVVYPDGSSGSSSSTAARRRRRAQSLSFVAPTYFLSESDTVAGVDVRLSMYVAPSEAALLAGRLAGALNGSTTVLPGGWEWEVALARQRDEAARQAAYCGRYYHCWNATRELPFFRSFGVPCDLYAPNSTCVRPSSSPSPRPPAAATSNSTSTVAAVAARRALQAASPALSPLLVVRTPWSPAGAAAYSAAYTWGTDLSALPRVGLGDVLGSLLPVLTAIAPLEDAYVDPYAAPPSPFLSPVGVAVVQPPAGTPAAPLWAGSPFAIQPTIALVDRHGRLVTQVDGVVLRVVAAVVADDLPPEQHGAVVLTGATVVRTNGTEGVVTFADLGVAAAPNGTTSTLRLAFNCTYRAGVTVATLTGVTAPFVLLPPPVVPVVVVPREPLNPWVVGCLFVAGLAAVVAGVWCGLRVARRWHTPARVVDAGLAAAAVAARARKGAAADGNAGDTIAIDGAGTSDDEEPGDADGATGGSTESVGGSSGGDPTAVTAVAAGAPSATTRGRRVSALMRRLGATAAAAPPVSSASLPGVGPAFAAAVQRTLDALAHVEAPPPPVSAPASASASTGSATGSSKRRRGGSGAVFGWATASSRRQRAAAAPPPPDPVPLPPPVTALLQRFARPGEPDEDAYTARQAAAAQRAYAREAARNGAGWAALSFAAGTVAGAVTGGARAAGAALVDGARAAAAQLRDEADEYAADGPPGVVVAVVGEGGGGDASVDNGVMPQPPDAMAAVADIRGGGVGAGDGGT